MDKEEKIQDTKVEKTETQKTSETHEKPVKKDRRLVVPGETIVSAEDHLPGDFTRNEGGDIVASRYGLAETSGRVVKVIPISGVFEPRRGNTVIARVSDITFSGWVMEIGGPYGAFLPLAECPRFIDRNNLAEFANIGDVLSVKTYGVKKGSIDLTLKSRGLGKLDGGVLIKINSHKVPRVIGKEGSMINLIKDNTSTEITVGQNGYVWIKGDEAGEKKAGDAVKLIEQEAASDGLTEKVEKFLGVKK
tara:strand:- start:15719 stop:16462 length:744 start_codon:yes stop_codon:yes gene_type:complete